MYPRGVLTCMCFCMNGMYPLVVLPVLGHGRKVSIGLLTCAWAWTGSIHWWSYLCFGMNGKYPLRAYLCFGMDGKHPLACLPVLWHGRKASIGLLTCACNGHGREVSIACLPVFGHGREVSIGLLTYVSAWTGSIHWRHSRPAACLCSACNCRCNFPLRVPGPQICCGAFPF